MKNIRLFTLFLFAILSSTMMAGTIYSFTVTRATTTVGTYDAVGGTAECTRAMAVDGSNEVTIGSQTFYKFNTSTEWKFTLVGNTLAAGDVITFTCACSSNKTGKGLIANGVTLTNDFTQGSPNTLTHTVAAGDAFVGKTIISVTRADSDIKFGSIEITRGEGSGTDPGTDPGTNPGTDPTPSSGGYDEIIRSTLSGERASVQTVTGTIGGTSAVKNMGSSSPYKLNADGAYVSIVLASGYYEPTDTLIIDGSKAMQVYYGPAEGGTLLLTTPAPTNGVIRTPLTILPANQNSIYVYRVSSTYNGTLTYMAVHRPAPAGPSNDATLSSLVYGSEQTTVDNFSSSQTSYEVELPATYVGAPPTIQGTTTDANANITDVTQATSIPGTASITVTAEDGTTTMTYSVTFTRASAEPKVESATWANIKGTASIDQVNKTITGQVTNGSSLTLTPQFTGKNISSISPEGAQNFANGAISYTFTSSTSEQTTYSVTITEAPAVSSDATLKSLTYGGTSVPGFSPNTYVYNIEVNYGQKTPPTIAAETNHAKATKVITQATSIPGSGTVVVTAEDGTTKLTYTINYVVNSPVPSTNLTLHVPEKYELSEEDGGYGGTLAVSKSREYEVYYINRDANSKLSVAVSNADKAGCISTSTGSNSMKATDGWFNVSSSGSGGDTGGAKQDEFEQSIRKINMKEGDVVELHVNGYDQFSFYGKDNSNSTTKCFEVYINDVKQSTTPDNTYSIRRFTLTGESVIRVTALSSSNSNFLAFSLRLKQEPKAKYFRGNDTAQVLLQTMSIKPVFYTVKYNRIPGAETRLEWNGAEGTGITLGTTEGEVTDTLYLTGTANCPVGTYNYSIVTYYNGQETSRVNGSFRVKATIQATSGLNMLAYKDEDMEEPITFRYYALNASDVQLTWTGATPDGITGSGNNGVYTISGRPTAEGTFPYSITVTDGDTTLTGQIEVRNADMGSDPILYLYKNESAYEHDPVYNHLKGSKNLIARKALKTGTRTAEQYAKYKWILISEDADADNEEVLAIVRGGANLPVLNMKGFTYTEDRLGWGWPDNGTLDTISKNGRNIFINRPDHPIFKKFNAQMGGLLPIFDTVVRNGVMPITINDEVMRNTLCLATGYTRSIEDYYGDGERQTAIHEIPAAMRGGQKYICMPLALHAGNELSPQGRTLIEAIVSYLTDPNTETLSAPVLQMNSFSIMGVAGTIDQTHNTIDMAFDITQFPDLDLSAVVPTIKLESPYTFVTPASGETVNFQYSMFMPVKFVVSDYICTRTYNVTVRTYDPQGIEQVYTAGEWVNLYDIYGRLIATTNEDIYSMELPHGMYIAVTENGQTIKIMK